MPDVIDFRTRRADPNHPDDERRSERRRRVRRQAALHFNNGYGVFEASVRNQSRYGACLDIPSTIGVPSRFNLVVSGVKVGEARVRWRTPTQLGLRLQEPFPIDLLPR